MPGSARRAAELVVAPAGVASGRREQRCRRDGLEATRSCGCPASQQARSDIERLVAARHGYIAQLEFSAPEEQPRSLNGSLRIPVAQLDPFLAEIKRLGRVVTETQRGDDVTQKYVDTEARLSNL